MNPNLLQTPIDYLKGVGPSRADLLRSELGIHTYQDLVNLFPNRYIDKTKYYKINELQRTSAEVQIVGKIINIKTVEQKKGLFSYQDDQFEVIDLPGLYTLDALSLDEKISRDFIVLYNYIIECDIINIIPP